MLRDDADVALNRVVVQCESNARRFRYTADLLEHPASARLLYALADARDAMATDLRHQVRQRGELPHTANVERQTLEELKDRITAALAREGQRTVLLGRVEDEEHLAAAAAAALELALPDESRLTMEYVRKEAEFGAERLRAAQACPHP